MIAATRSIEISRPVPEVFRFVATHHLENHRRWDRTIINLEQTTAGPVGVGTEFTFSRRIMGRVVPSRMRVIEFVPNRALIFSLTGPLNMEMRTLVEPSGEDHTRLTFQAAGHLSGLMRLAEPIVGRRMGREFGESQRQIKTMLEETAALDHAGP